MSKESVEQAYRTAIDRVRLHKASHANADMTDLLEAWMEKMKEDSIGKPIDDVLKYHGAIEHVRRLLADIKREEVKQIHQTGAYST